MFYTENPASFATKPVPRTNPQTITIKRKIILAFYHTNINGHHNILLTPYATKYIVQDIIVIFIVFPRDGHSVKGDGRPD